MNRKILFSVISFLLVVLVMELAGAVILHLYPAINKTRHYLAGEAQFQDALNVVSQAYLLYIPAPGFKSHDMIQHNAQGYRGDAVPFARQADSLRVLFMGGSTTYGEAVQDPQDSYPAQFGKRLRADPAFASRNIEIINAGVRWGTSAEILTHYLLKYRYYQPDMVVINPGGNDPSGYATPPYHPDYSNWRKAPETIKPLRAHARWLLQSRLLSAVVVLLFFPELPEGTTFVHHGELPAYWFVPHEKGRIQVEENAFYNNLSTVVREIRNDGAEVFLLSYQGNPFDTGDQEQWRRLYDYEESLLQQIAKEQQVAFAPFPLSLMQVEDWADPSHLTQTGENKKAGYVLESAKPVLQRRLACSDCRSHVIHSPVSALEVDQP